MNEGHTVNDLTDSILQNVRAIRVVAETADRADVSHLGNTPNIAVAGIKAGQTQRRYHVILAREQRCKRVVELINAKPGLVDKSG